MNVNLTREECLANGMSEKEYAIQKALGSLPNRDVGKFVISGVTADEAMKIMAGDKE